MTYPIKNDYFSIQTALLLLTKSDNPLQCTQLSKPQCVFHQSGHVVFYYFHVNKAVLFLAAVHFNFEKYASVTENCIIVHERGLSPGQLSKTFQRFLLSFSIYYTNKIINQGDISLSFCRGGFINQIQNAHSDAHYHKERNVS